jgi:GNAT superfamily N-acetyltransferase
MRVDFVTIITDKEDKLAAFGITMPSLSVALQKSGGRLFPFGFIYILRAMKKNDSADFLMVAVRKDLQGKGVNALLIHETAKSYIKNGVKYVETNHELEDNRKIRSMWDDFDSRQHKRRRCFIRHL